MDSEDHFANMIKSQKPTASWIQKEGISKLIKDLISKPTSYYNKCELRTRQMHHSAAWPPFPFVSFCCFRGCPLPICAGV